MVKEARTSAMGGTGMEVFLHPFVFRLAILPSQLPVKWVVVISYLFLLPSSSSSYHQCALPKGRSFTTNVGTKIAVLSKDRSSTANSGTKVAVLLGINRCGSFPLFSASPLSLVSEQILKDSRDPNVGVRSVNLVNRAFRTSPKLTTGVKYPFHQGFWPDQRFGNPNHLSPAANKWTFLVVFHSL